MNKGVVDSSRNIKLGSYAAPTWQGERDGLPREVRELPCCCDHLPGAIHPAFPFPFSQPSRFRPLSSHPPSQPLRLPSSLPSSLPSNHMSNPLSIPLSSQSPSRVSSWSVSRPSDPDQQADPPGAGPVTGRHLCTLTAAAVTAEETGARVGRSGRPDTVARRRMVNMQRYIPHTRVRAFAAPPPGPGSAERGDGGRGGRGARAGNGTRLQGKLVVLYCVSDCRALRYLWGGMLRPKMVYLNVSG